MKLKFDPNQQFQLDAIDAAVDIFEGQPLNQGDFEIKLQHGYELKGLVQQDLGFGNNLSASDDVLNANLKQIQKQYLPIRH